MNAHIVGFGATAKSTLKPNQVYQKRS